MRTFAAAAFLTLAGLPLAAHAQPLVQVGAVSTEATTRGLEAQYQAALIRERRLADERETALIERYEREMRAARAAFDRGAAGAAAQLDAARLQYANFVSEVAARDEEARALIAAYQAQLSSDIGQASPEQLAALQRFADGDIEAGFNEYAEESRRRAAARRQVAENVAQQVRQADARDARQLARMGETMQANGRMSMRQVTDLYATAADLDPTHFNTLWRLAFMASSVGDDALRLRSEERMRAAASSDAERQVLAMYEVSILIGQARPQEAAARMREAIDLARAMVARAPSGLDAQRILRKALAVGGQAFGIVGDLRTARELAAEQLSVAEQIAAQSGANDADRGELAMALAARAEMGSSAEVSGLCQRAREILAGLSDARGARELVLQGCSNALAEHGQASEALVLLRELETSGRQRIALDPTDVGARRALGLTLYDIGDILKDLRDYPASRAALEESIALLEERRAAGAQPTDWEVLGDAYHNLGDIFAELEDGPRALGAYRNGRARQADIERVFATPRSRLVLNLLNRKYEEFALLVEGPDALRAELSSGGAIQERDLERAIVLLTRIADQANERGERERHAWSATEALAAARRWRGIRGDWRVIELLGKQSMQFLDFGNAALAERYATESLSLLRVGYEPFNGWDGDVFVIVPIEGWVAQVCLAQLTLGHSHARQGQRDEARAAYEVCLDHIGEAIPQLRSESSARVLANYMALAAGGLAEAGISGATWTFAWEAAGDIPENAREPLLRRYLPAFEVGALYEEALSLSDAERWSEALVAYRAASVVAERVIANNQDSIWWLDRGATLVEGAIEADRSMRREPAESDVTRTLELRRRVYSLAPSDDYNARRHSQNLDWWGFTLAERGRATEALPLLREGLQIRRVLAARLPADQVVAHSVAMSMESLSLIPNSGVSRRDVIAYLEGIQRRNLANAEALEMLQRLRTGN